MNEQKIYSGHNFSDFFNDLSIFFLGGGGGGGGIHTYFRLFSDFHISYMILKNSTIFFKIP